MAKTKHLPEHYGYSCVYCIYYFDYHSDIFGSCSTCKHKPTPSNIDEVFDGEEPCEFFNYDVFIPKYKHVKESDVYRKI